MLAKIRKNFNMQFFVKHFFPLFLNNKPLFLNNKPLFLNNKPLFKITFGETKITFGVMKNTSGVFIYHTSTTTRKPL